MDGSFDKVSGREDLNLRPHGPEPCALPDCATPRYLRYYTEIGTVMQFGRTFSFSLTASPQRIGGIFHI